MRVKPARRPVIWIRVGSPSTGATRAMFGSWLVTVFNFCLLDTWMMRLVLSGTARGATLGATAPSCAAARVVIKLPRIRPRNKVRYKEDGLPIGPPPAHRWAIRVTPMLQVTRGLRCILSPHCEMQGG